MRLRRSTKVPRKRGRIRKLRLLAVITILVVLSGMAFSFGLVRAVASEIPELDPAAQRTEVDGVVYASNGDFGAAVRAMLLRALALDEAWQRGRG